MALLINLFIVQNAMIYWQNNSLMNSKKTNKL